MLRQPVETSPDDTDTEGFWWLRTRWLSHRTPVEDVHPLLVALQRARGSAFMTYERARAVIDAKDPEALVREWVERRPVRGRRLGLPPRVCAWQKGEEACDQPVGAQNAKFCRLHASMSTRQAKRRYARDRRECSNPE